jgi:gas vesicle protein
MENERRDDSDFLTALAIGAAVGIGAALLFRASDDLDREKIIRKLKPLKKKANRALHRATERVGRESSRAVDLASKKMNRKMSDVRGAGRIIKKGGGRIAHNLSDDAAKIVAEAKREMEASARDSVKIARRAMRRAAKRLV